MVAVDAARRMSHASMSSAPPPRAMPLTAAMTGTGNASRRSSKRRGRSNADCNCARVTSSRYCLMSPPELKNLLPAPVMTTATSSRSFSRAVIASSRATVTSALMELPAWGRSMVSSAARSRRSTRSTSDIIAFHQLHRTGGTLDVRPPRIQLPRGSGGAPGLRHKIAGIGPCPGPPDSEFQRSTPATRYAWKSRNPLTT